MSPTASLTWHPLESLDARFRANLAALETRDAALAGRLRHVAVSTSFFISAAGDNVHLGRSGPAGIERIADPVPPAAARSLAGRVYANGFVTGPMVVSGLGYGWLWDRLAKLPCKVEILPGHRPPVYFLAGDIEQLWAVLHVMDWRAMLAERRFPIFAGPDALDQFKQALVADPTSPEPGALIQIDSTLPKQEIGALLAELRGARDVRLLDLHRRLELHYAPPRGLDWPQKFRGGSLRVLGITSRYTTFLQHSMRDWLSAFERLGHETRLVIEDHDHLMLGAFGYAQSILDFKPDLILLIDHYRAEVGRIPQSIPCVMWVQDRLPNIFSPAAGRAQGARDYCIGGGRLHLASRHAYPADRFMSCTIGINERKYASHELSSDDRAKFACEASYVGHSSVPSDVLLRENLDRGASPELAKVAWDLHERMIAHFECGGSALTDTVLEARLAESMKQAGVELGEATQRNMLAVFNQQINNALFRHQALRWVADAGVDLRLYGNGWEKHPQLKKFARGPADNVRDLPRIYQASKINLQIIPHGAVHQRLLDGLAAGGFFLIRRTAGDMTGAPYLKLWNWCRRNGITSDFQLRSEADDAARNWIREIDRLLGYDTATIRPTLYECLEATADTDFMILAAAVWPEQYPQVSFDSAAELGQKLGRYLDDAQERARITRQMREVVIDRCSYLSISRRLVQFIARDIAQGSSAEQRTLIAA